jgi:Domain of unknown function (DUF4412)
MRKLIYAVTIACVCGTSLRAELKYTMKMEAHASTAPAAGPGNPMMAMIGNLVMGTLLPSGTTVTTFIVGEKGTRTEFDKPNGVVQAGGVTLLRPDGTMVVLNPSEKTYWKSKAPDASLMPGGMVPKVTTKATGEMSTVAGIRAERVVIEIHLALPLPEGMQLPPGVPSELVIASDTWMSKTYAAYAKLSGGLLGALGVGLGLDKQSMPEGFMVRSVMRSEIFGDQEIESVVTKIGEEKVAAALFDIPADYKEVPAPAGIGGGMSTSGGRHD